jgi:hypothetical protein
MYYKKKYLQLKATSQVGLMVDPMVDLMVGGSPSDLECTVDLIIDKFKDIPFDTVDKQLDKMYETLGISSLQNKIRELVKINNKKQPIFKEVDLAQIANDQGIDYNILDSQFMSPKIGTYISKNVTFCHVSNDDDTTFIVDCKSKDNDITNKGYIWTKVFSSLYKDHTQNRKFYPFVVLIQAPFKKCLPEKSEEQIIKPEHINSGYSTPYYTVVFRKEEALKVLIHELLHHLQLDSPQHCNLYNHPFQYFNSDGSKRDLLLNETYVELIATIFNTMFNITGSDTKSGFIKGLKKEIMFSMYQTAKIVNFYNVDLQALFNGAKVVSGASILEYHMFKSALLYNTSELINFLNEIQDSNNLFKITSQKAKLFIDLCYKSAKKDEFIRAIGLLQKRIGDTSCKTTLKMTIT